MTTDSNRLVARFRQGDGSAFEELVARYQDRVFSQCYRLTGNHADAEDLAQEVFVKAYQGLGRFRGEASLGTWLHRIAVNTHLNAVKRRERRVPALSLDQPVEGSDGEMQVQLAADQADPAELVAQAELRQVVAQALATLPAEHRTVLVLREFEGCSYEEMAHLLGCSLGTVKSRLSRARQALRQAVSVLAKDQRVDIPGTGTDADSEW